MVIIAVDNCPLKMHMKEMIKELASVVRVEFEGLVFRNAKDSKTLYLRVTNKYPIEEVINRINQKVLKGRCLKSYIPDLIPGIVTSAKPKMIPKKVKKKLQIEPVLTKNQILHKSLEHILREMQLKYTGLHPLSEKTGHHLLDNLAREISNRLNKILDRYVENDKSFKLTSSYRRKYPHSTDFQLIVTVLHNVQTVLDMPLTNIQEEAFIKENLRTFPKETIKQDQLQQLVDAHIKRISDKLVEHVRNLDVTTKPSTPAEEAKIKVRKQLKKMDLYLPELVKTVIKQHNFTPNEDTYHVVKIYGEPYLPGKTVMAPFTNQFNMASTIRSDLMYNLLSVKVHRSSLQALLAMDGHKLQTPTGNVKLVIRAGASLPIYLCKASLSTEPSGTAEASPPSPPGEEEATEFPSPGIEVEAAQPPPPIIEVEAGQPPPPGTEDEQDPQGDQGQGQGDQVQGHGGQGQGQDGQEDQEENMDWSGTW